MDTSFIEAKQRILSFKNLPENWDSYGAKTPSDETIQNSIKFLEDIVTVFVQTPIVVPCSGDRIQFEWISPNFQLEIAIDKMGILDIFKVNLGAIESEEDWFESLYNCPKLQSVLKELIIN